MMQSVRPLTPTLSPRTRGEGGVFGRSRRSLLDGGMMERAVPPSIGWGKSPGERSPHYNGIVTEENVLHRADWSTKGTSESGWPGRAGVQ